MKTSIRYGLMVLAAFVLAACSGVPGDVTPEGMPSVSCGVGTHLVGSTCEADTDGAGGHDMGIGTGGGTATTTSTKMPPVDCVPKADADGVVPVEFIVDCDGSPGMWEVRGNLIEHSGGWTSFVKTSDSKFGFSATAKGTGHFNGSNDSAKQYLVENSDGNIRARCGLKYRFSNCPFTEATALGKSTVLEPWSVVYGFDRVEGVCPDGPNYAVNASPARQSVALCN